MTATITVAAVLTSVALHLLVIGVIAPHGAERIPVPAPRVSVLVPLTPAPVPAERPVEAEVAAAPADPVADEPAEPAPTARTRRARLARSTARRRAPAAPVTPAEPQPSESVAPGSALSAWMRRNIGDPRWVSAGESGSLLRGSLTGPLSLERHADSSVTFRGNGVEGCRYPDGTVQTRRDRGGDPCCHADAIDDCGCPEDDADPAARAAVLEQLRSEL